jgi:hypothetical protein
LGVWGASWILLSKYEKSHKWILGTDVKFPHKNIHPFALTPGDHYEPSCEIIFFAAVHSVVRNIVHGIRGNDAHGETGGDGIFLRSPAKDP